MAREFDELRSRRRALGAFDIPHLQGRSLDRTGESAPPPSTRIRDLRPKDPAVDTFDARYKGDQVPLPEPAKSDYIYVPGSQERYGDETKVISDLPPSLGAPHARAAREQSVLPPGFSFGQAPEAEGQSVLPPGFSFGAAAVTEPEPLPTRPGLPEDPAERAALTMQQSVRPAGGRREGAATKVIEGAVTEPLKAITGLTQSVMEEGRADPRQALEVAATVSPVSPVYRAMRTMAGAKPSVPEFTPRPPMPHGPPEFTPPPPPQMPGTKEASDLIRRTLETAPAAPASMRNLAKSEDIIADLVETARTGTGQSLVALSQLRRQFDTGDYATIQGAVISKLGQNPSGTFDLGVWLRNYEGIPSQGKTILFGRESGSLRQHLDALTAAAKNRAQPMDALARTLPPEALTKGLSDPAGAASMAHWLQAYNKFIASGGESGVARLIAVSKNLGNTLGADVDLKALVTKAPAGE